MPKARILDAVKEAVTPEAADNLAKLKKDALAWASRVPRSYLEKVAMQPNPLARAERYRREAELARGEAAAMQDQELNRLSLEIAERYDRLAEAVERTSRTGAIDSINGLKGFRR